MSIVEVVTGVATTVVMALDDTFRVDDAAATELVALYLVSVDGGAAATVTGDDDDDDEYA